MKQVLQTLGNGETLLAEVPVPRVRPGHLLIETRASLVSVGTERMLVEFGKAGWLEKARQQPEKVAQVLRKVKTDGLFPTLEAVRSKLDVPLALGYCNAGVVQEVGEGVIGYAPGDRVISNGPHAEVVCVGKNLCAKVPDKVDFETAVFAVPGAIGLQGIRLLGPVLGERIVVIGLGLIGLLSLQLLRANGCEVLGIDPDSRKCGLARQFGALTVDLSAGEDSLGAAQAFTRGRGVDGVLITASTLSNDPVQQAAAMCRLRGRIVLVGVTGLELNRADFYAKELSFQVSCSYGPGRYDSEYEDKGNDYPFGLVRWTEQRNFEAVLKLMANGALDVKPLVTHRYSIAEAERAYEAIAGSGAAQAIGVILEYTGPGTQEARVGTEGEKVPFTVPLARPRKIGDICVAVIGAGNYASRVLLPELAKMPLRLKTLVSSRGLSGAHFGKKFRFEQTTTDPATVFVDEEVEAVIIATRHDSHGEYVLDALKAGKSVFVEKPLCLTPEELQEIKNCYDYRDGDGLVNGGEVAGEGGRPRPDSDSDPDSDSFGEGGRVRPDSDSDPDSDFSRGLGGGGRSGSGLSLLMVGFNRRFSPHVVRMKELLGRKTAPLAMTYMVNAGAIPASHWTQDPEIGGGRLVGEACHFVDLCRFLAGSPISRMTVDALNDGGSGLSDSALIQLKFANGSIATIQYLAKGHPGVPKERLEVFCEGSVLQLNDFRELLGHGWNRFRKLKTRRIDKGHGACLAAFFEAIKVSGEPPIPVPEIWEVSDWILKA